MGLGTTRRAVYRADRLWDGSSASAREGAAVLVRDGRIVAVVPADEVPAFEEFRGVPVSSFRGCTILPGLIDAHTHLAPWMLPAFLSAGVTTVRDTGGRVDVLVALREAARTSPARSPRVLGTGPVLDGPTARWTGIGRAHADATAIVASVHELADAGVDAIKLYTDVTADQMRAATTAAHGRGLPVLAHLGPAGTVAARHAGVDEIEHLSGIVPTILPPGAATDEVALSAAAAIPWHCTTLVVWDRLARSRDPVFASDARNSWVHPDIRAAWLRFPHRALDTATTTGRQAAVVAMKRIVRPLLERGARILTGTDTPWPWLVPGWSLHDELALLQDAGVTRLEVLRAATSAAAAALGRDDLGRIAPGATADLLVVEGDPVLRLPDLARIRHVVRDGCDVDLAGLHTLALELQAMPARAPIDELIVGFADRTTGPSLEEWDTGSGQHC